jgi:hypothetical protein
LSSDVANGSKPKETKKAVERPVEQGKGKGKEVEGIIASPIKSVVAEKEKQEDDYWGGESSETEAEMLAATQASVSVPSSSPVSTQQPRDALQAAFSLPGSPLKRSTVNVFEFEMEMDAAAGEQHEDEAAADTVMTDLDESSDQIALMLLSPTLKQPSQSMAHPLAAPAPTSSTSSIARVSMDAIDLTGTSSPDFVAAALVSSPPVIVAAFPPTSSIPDPAPSPAPRPTFLAPLVSSGSSSSIPGIGASTLPAATFDKIPIPMASTSTGTTIEPSPPRNANPVRNLAILASVLPPFRSPSLAAGNLSTSRSSIGPISSSPPPSPSPSPRHHLPIEQLSTPAKRQYHPSSGRSTSKYMRSPSDSPLSSAQATPVASPTKTTLPFTRSRIINGININASAKGKGREMMPGQVVEGRGGSRRREHHPFEREISGGRDATPNSNGGRSSRSMGKLPSIPGPLFRGPLDDESSEEDEEGDDGEDGDEDEMKTKEKELEEEPEVDNSSSASEDSNDDDDLANQAMARAMAKRAAGIAFGPTASTTPATSASESISPEIRKSSRAAIALSKKLAEPVKPALTKHQKEVIEKGGAMMAKLLKEKEMRDRRGMNAQTARELRATNAEVRRFTES